MSNWTKWIVTLLMSLPLIWLIYNQTGMLNEARNYEARAKQDFDELHAVSLKQQELSSLQQTQRQILMEVKQLVYLYVGQGLPIPDDFMRGENLIVVRSGFSDYLDVRLWLPKKKRVSVMLEKIEGARVQPIKPEGFLKVDLETAGWHSITSKLDESKSGNRLPLLVDGKEVYSIDFGVLKSNGGSSYSPGSLPRTFQIKPLEDKTSYQVAHHWNLLFDSKTGTPMPYGYGVQFLSFEKLESGETATIEQ